MQLITRRAALVGAASLAACTRTAANREPAESEGRVAVPGGHVAWRRIGGGAKTPLLVVHGGPGATSTYLEPLGALGDERAVYFWDQLGCGLSEHPDDPALWRIERFVEEMALVRAALGLDSVHILGQSWGTCLTVDYLLAKGQTGVRSIVLAGPVMSARRYISDVAAMVAEMSPEDRAAIAEAERTGVFGAPAYGAATERFYATHVARHPSEVTGPLLQRSFENLDQDSYVAMNGASEFSITGSLQTYEREAQLAGIQTPTLYLCGEYDTCTPGAAREYAAAMPHAEVAVVPDSGHMETIDAPDETNAIVRAFLNRFNS